MSIKINAINKINILSEWRPRDLSNDIKHKYYWHKKKGKENWTETYLRI